MIKITRLNKGIKDFINESENGHPYGKKQLNLMRKMFHKETKGKIQIELGNLIIKINNPRYDSYGSMKTLIEDFYQGVKDTDPKDFYELIEQSRINAIKTIKKMKNINKFMPKSVK